jgi:hypothetical protein
MKLVNQLKYPLINSFIVYEDDELTEIPFDKPFGSL